MAENEKCESLDSVYAKARIKLISCLLRDILVLLIIGVDLSPKLPGIESGLGETLTYVSSPVQYTNLNISNDEIVKASVNSNCFSRLKYM